MPGYPSKSRLRSQDACVVTQNLVLRLRSQRDSSDIRFLDRGSKELGSRGILRIPFVIIYIIVYSRHIYRDIGTLSAGTH